MYKSTFEAIGTQWTIDIYDLESPEKGEGLMGEIRKRIEVFDRDYSRFRADSLVAEMATKVGSYQLPSDAQPLFDMYRDLYDISGGAVTPLIGATLSDAGYDSEYSLKPKAMSSPPAWDEALDYSFPGLVIKKPSLIDIGAAGKGYLVDIVSEMILAAGLSHFCVDAGGDMRHVGPEGQPLRVGLENPHDAAQAIGVVRLENASVCGSSGNRRTWAGYHHILDPFSLQSPRHIQAVWVVAGSTLVADAMTTLLYFVPAQRARQSFAFEYAIVGADGKVEASADFPAEFFS